MNETEDQPVHYRECDYWVGFSNLRGWTSSPDKVRRFAQLALVCPSVQGPSEDCLHLILTREGRWMTIEGIPMHFPEHDLFHVDLGTCYNVDAELSRDLDEAYTPRQSAISSDPVPSTDPVPQIEMDVRLNSPPVTYPLANQMMPRAQDVLLRCSWDFDPGEPTLQIVVRRSGQKPSNYKIAIREVNLFDPTFLSDLESGS